MDDSRGSKCSSGQTSGASMGGRLQSNTSPPNRPTLSPLMAIQTILPDGSLSGRNHYIMPITLTLTLNINWTVGSVGTMEMLGADYTRSNNNS